MDDYVKQLEAQNEELKELLARKEMIDCKDNILYKDIVLDYFVRQIKDDLEEHGLDKERQSVIRVFLNKSPETIVNEYWSMAPLSIYNFRGLHLYGDGDNSINEFQKYLTKVIADYQEILRNESQNLL